MRTNSRQRSNRSPPGDTRRTCAYCGIEWYRSELVRDGANLLAGPCCQRGRDIVTLALGNAAMASSRQIGEPRMASDGSIDSTPTETPPPLNWNGPPAPIVNGGPTGPLSVQTTLWLRGDSVQLSSSGLASIWRDKSSLNNDIAASGEAAQPTYTAADSTLRNLPTVTGDGVNHFMQGNRFRYSAPLWVWCIMKQVSWAIGQTQFSAGFAMKTGAVTPELRLLTNGSSTANVGAPIGQWVRGIASFNIAGVDMLQLVATTVSDLSAGQRLGPTFSLFSALNGAAKANVAFAEVLATAGPPTATEIAAIEAYGVARYGGSLFS